MACLDDDTIAMLAQGLLAGDQRDQAVQHLDTCETCTLLVAEAARTDDDSDVMGQTLVRPEPAPSFAVSGGPLQPGTALGRYLVLAPLGSGGLGDVYTAYDPKLDRRVAVKLLKADAKSERQDLEARLLREAQALARVRHPNVVSVHDVGTAGGTVFVAMELVDGVTLRRWLDAEPRSWSAVRDVMVEAGEGLCAAHDAGLVHRDFKPGNVMVDAGGRVVVLDFGLARAMAEVAHSHQPGTDAAVGTSLVDRSVTATGVILGTPAYMPPEQFGSKRVDARADQFAFCVTFFEALYGDRPFRGATARAQIAAIERGNIVQIPADRRAPAWLHRAIVRGLHALPEGRHASMRELLHVLVRDRRSRRRQILAVATVAITAAAAGFGGAVLRTAEPTPEELAHVEQLTEQARAGAEAEHFVYPPPEDPNFPTAYRKVIELEGIEGTAASIAKQRATELRETFAADLLALGDRYWKEAEGKGFAADFYSQALVFDPDDPTALSRTLLTPGQAAVLAQKAASGEFTERELIAAEPLSVLAEPDEAQRKTKLARLGNRKARGRSRLTQSKLETLVPNTEAATEFGPAPVPETVAQPGPEVVPEAMPTVAPPTADNPPSPAPRSSKPKPPPRATPTTAPGDPTADLAAARTAAKAGRLKESERLYHRALGSNPRSLDALMGLNRLHWNSRAYGKAAKFAKRAVDLAPENAEYRVRLGDAYQKLFRYPDARAQYVRARDLGHPSAGRKLARLDDRVARP